MMRAREIDKKYQILCNLINVCLMSKSRRAHSPRARPIDLCEAGDEESAIRESRDDLSRAIDDITVSPESLTASFDSGRCHLGEAVVFVSRIPEAQAIH